MWDFYNRTIAGVPDGIFVDYIKVGSTWTIVQAGKYCGIAVTVNEQDSPVKDYSFLYGRSLREVAELCKSWDFTDASVGTAALNAYLNSKENAEKLGCSDTTSAFDDYKEKAAEKKCAIIGHFIHLERFLTDSEVFVLERRPLPGDYPDSACEYILPEMDYTFITGSAFINKTLPRLLELSRYPVILGPSTPLSPVLFDYGARELSTFTPDFYSREEAEKISRGDVRLRSCGTRIRLLRR